MANRRVTDPATPGRLERLVDEGLLTQEQLDTVVSEQRRTKKSFARLLLDLEILTEEELPRFFAAWKGLEYVDLNEYPLDPSAASLIPESMARQHAMLPIGFNGDRLVVALADPMNIVLLDDVRIVTDRDVDVVVASPDNIREALNRLTSLDGSAEAALEDTDAAEESEEAELHERLAAASAEDAPIVKAVNRIITQAVQQRASDIHIEPEERDLRVRYRIDGVLREVMRVPRAHQAGVVSRIKVMADVDIAEKRVPQDGRVSLRADDKPIDLRVSTLPSVWGEEISIRILDRSTSLVTLGELGYSEHALERYQEVTGNTYGAILLTGPTGSGKSTTLYATLNEINDASKKIITVEDPVEYRIDGLRQMQVHPYIGLTFAAALRSILRSDPDVIMVGEIRDTETGRIAVHAAMTGHLVLSTLHTNDAPTAPTRLVEMGVEPFLVASAIDCVMAQRLVRRVCPRCSEPYKPKRSVLEQAGFPLKENQKIPELRRAVGCRYCAETGYRDRIAIAEVMLFTEEIEGLVAERAPSEEIRRAALASGMRTLREDGMAKVAEGVTTLEEVLRVIA